MDKVMLVTYVVLGLMALQAVLLYADLGDGGTWLDPGLDPEQEFSVTMFLFVLASGAVCLSSAYHARRPSGLDGEFEYLTIRAKMGVLERNVSRMKVGAGLNLCLYGLAAALAAYATTNAEHGGRDPYVMAAMSVALLAAMSAMTGRSVLGTIRTVRRFNGIKRRLEGEGAL